MKKKWLIIGAVVLVVLLFVGLVGSRVKEKKQRDAALKNQVPPPPAVAVALPRNGRIADTLKLPGNVVSQQSVQVIPKVSGRLMTLLVNEGSPVRAGQLLGEIEHTELDAQLLQAQASAQASKANLDLQVNGPLPTQIAQSRASVRQLEASLGQLQATRAQNERDLERQQNLANEGVATQQQLETTRTQLQSVQQQILAMQQQIAGARASLQQLLDGTRPEQIAGARAQYNQALATIALYKAQLANYRLISPLNGVVTRKYLDAGNLVAAPNPILTLNQSARPEIEVFLPERNLGEVRLNQDVEVSSGGLGNRTLHGHISRISPVVDPQTRLVKLTVLLDTPEQLRAGMLLDCTIVLSAKAHVLMVPVDSVVREGNKSYVYTVANNQVQSRTVTTGLRTPDEVEIRQGIGPKDQVIIRGTSFVRPGDKVQVQKPVQEVK